MFSNDSIVGTILVCGRVYQLYTIVRSIIGFAQNRRILSFASCLSSSFSFFLCLEADASTGFQSAMFLANLLAHLFDHLRDSFTLAHISHIRLWRIIDNLIMLRYRKLVNSFLYLLFVSVLSIIVLIYY